MKVRELISGCRNKAPKGSVPYLEIGNIDVKSKEYDLTDKPSVSGACYANKNNIVVSTVRPTRGAIAILKEDLVVSSALTILDVDESKCIPKYLFYALNNVNFLEYLGSKQSGATYPTCGHDDIYNYEFTFEKDINEQKRIVDEMDIITELIRNRKEQLKDLLDLIEAKYNEIISNSREKKKIKELISKVDNIKGKELKIRYIDISSINKELNEINSFTEYDLRQAPSRARQIIYKDDILFSSVRPNLKTVAKVKYDFDNMIGSTGFIVLRANEKVIPEYLLRAVLSKEFTESMKLKTAGAAYPAVSPSDVYNEEIPWVNRGVQEIYKKYANNLEEQIEIIKKEIIDLEQLFEVKIHTYFKKI